MRSVFKGRRPSPALIISTIALFAAIGGVAGALPGTNTINSGDIKNGKVKSADLKNNNVKGVDINEGSLGTVPSANTANFAAQAGGPTLFARLDDPNSQSPGVIEADSRGLTDANFFSPTIGVHCIVGVPGIKSASVVGDQGNPNNNDNDILTTFTLGDPFGDCPGANGIVYVYESSGGGVSDNGFYIQLYT